MLFFYRVNDVKFTCDIMLEEDVLSNRDDRELCIKIVINGNRYILAKGSFNIRVR